MQVQFTVYMLAYYKNTLIKLLVEQLKLWGRGGGILQSVIVAIYLK